MLKNGFSKNKLLCIQSIMKIFEIKIRFFFKYGYFFVRWRSFMLSCRKESSINTF